jgi:hypothetical protein
MEPECGQLSENDSEPPSSEIWAVLHEDESGSYLANDPLHLEPEARALAFESRAFSWRCDVLAGEPARDDIDAPAPWLAVEGAHVVPDREAWEVAGLLASE